MRAQSFLGPLVLTGTALRNVSHNVLNPDTEAFIKDLLKEWNSPGGISVAVVRRDIMGSWKVETKGYGLAGYDGRNMTDKTRFAIASNSKLFTTLATGLLISNETLSPRLSWKSKLTPLRPGWYLADPITTDYLTIIDAMSHRSGLPAHDLSYRFSDDITNVVDKMKYLRPSAEFRDVYQYCNLMYALLSTLPERVLPSKTPFTTYVKQHIFEPLGLNATTYDGAGDVAEGVLRQNTKDDPFGNGTIRALPFDLDWNGRGKAFPEMSPVVYGGGQRRYSYRGHELIEHSGGVTGHLSWIVRFPELGLGLSVYSNDNSMGNYLMTIIKHRLFDEALGLKPVDWNGRYKDLYLKQLARQTTTLSRLHDNTESTLATLTGLQGNYHNNGYGHLELCLVSSPPPSSASAKCQALASEAQRILPGAVTPNVATFLAEWKSPWCTHIHFSHFSGNTYNVSVLSSVPTGNKTDPFWTMKGLSGEPATPAWAEFDEGGVGFTGIWGAGDVSSPEGRTVQERAETIFDEMARRSAPPASAPSYVPHPSQRRAVGGGHDDEQSAFSRFLQNEILAPEKLPGNLNLLTGVTMFFGGVLAVRAWGELMIPA
ncbi:hypothetical protein H0H87_012078 [Tephrocybe sp. NHM501043]|nr:hypothetical protein H0H87_012078 [Tephrocybe sp. NHM501043]